MASVTSAHERCPECGAELAPGQARCWLCHRQVGHSSGPNPYASPRPTGENAALQFSLASLFLIMTLVAVGVGAFLVAPGLGVLFSVLSVPAFVRTVLAAQQQRRGGAPLTVGEKAGVFVMSFFIMVTIGIATSVAFFVACAGGAILGTGISGNDLGAAFAIGIGLGLVAAVPFAIWLLRVTGPSKMEFAKAKR